MDRFSLGGLVAKIVSFGDSFILGNELKREDGRATWPGLIAQDLGVDYDTRAEAGCGNEHIARQVYDFFYSESAKDTLAVINWTWCMRWDFFLHDAGIWVTLGPTCVPGKLQHLVGLDRASELVAFYQNYTGQSDVWNRFRSLQAIYAVQCWLKQHGINSIQTYMDQSLLATYPGDRLSHYAACKDPSWPDIQSEQDLQSLSPIIRKELDDDYNKQIMPDYVRCLQDAIKKDLEDFEGRSFLDWSHDLGFPMTDLLHPLDQAHRAAGDLWKDRYASALGM